MRPQHAQTEEYYQRLYAAHGYSPRSLGWDKGKQFLRFHQLTSSWRLAGASILDVGCGFGDFVEYLRRREIHEYAYTGIDLVGEFIAEGRRRFASPRATFLQTSLEDFAPPSTFDYVIASGFFGLKLEGVDGYDLIRRSLGRMFGLAGTALAADFISNRVDYAHEHNFNSAPATILEMAYGLSRRVMLRNDYFPFEFCVIIGKDDSFSRERTTFAATEAGLAHLIAGPEKP
jgi:SAM-dependent methyltransferase